jgi:hypothetical protein
MELYNLKGITQPEDRKIVEHKTFRIALKTEQARVALEGKIGDGEQERMLVQHPDGAGPSRVEMIRTRMTTAERKADTHRKIQPGGLIIKAGSRLR